MAGMVEFLDDLQNPQACRVRQRLLEELEAGIDCSLWAWLQCAIESFALAESSFSSLPSFQFKARWWSFVLSARA